MRLNSSSIYLTRDPFGDESLRGAVSVCAISDSSLVVNTLVQCIDLPEAEIELISPDDDCAAHIAKTRPDIIMMNISMLGVDYLTELTTRLRNLLINEKLPNLVTIGDLPPPSAFDVSAHYPSCYNILLPTQPFIEGERLRRHIIGNVIGIDFYHEKLRRSASLTLINMHVDRYKSGFELLLEEVLIVLENSFVHLGTALTLHKIVAEAKGISASAVDPSIRPLIKEAVSKMTAAEYEICFTEYTSRGIRISELEFVFAAAKLTSATNCVIIDRIDELNMN